MRLLIALLFATFSVSALAQDRLAIPLPSDAFPNYIAIGVGAAPDYLGSDEYIVGAVPAVNLELGPTQLRVLANWAMLDLAGDSNWSIGPSGIWRFGRNDVDDPVVRQLGDIDNTIELGVSLGYQFTFDDNPFKRLSFGVDVMHDVGGVHNDFVVNAFARGIYPLPWTGGAATIALGTSYVGENFAKTYSNVSPAQSALTGLPTFSASAGFRDIRGGVGIFQSLSKNWHLGAGLLYGRVIGDAGNSPIVSDRGSRNQFIFGLGVAYTWGGILDSM